MFTLLQKKFEVVILVNIPPTDVYRNLFNMFPISLTTFGMAHHFNFSHSNMCMEGYITIVLAFTFLLLNDTEDLLMSLFAIHIFSMINTCPFDVVVFPPALYLVCYFSYTVDKTHILCIYFANNILLCGFFLSVF